MRRYLLIEIRSERYDVYMSPSTDMMSVGMSTYKEQGLGLRVHIKPNRRGKSTSIKQGLG